jgi:hypothetical protein
MSSRSIGLLAMLALLVAAPPAAADDYAYDRELRWWVHNSLERASVEQGTRTKTVPKPVYVKCYTSRAAFERNLVARGEHPLRARYVIAYHVRGTSEIKMRAGTCRLAREFASGWITQDTAGAFKTLLHEAIHSQGLNGDERRTEALAITATRAAGQLAEWNRRLAHGALDEDAAWAGSVAAGDRAMRLAWQQSQRWVAPSYRSSWASVSRLLERESWADAVA